MASPESHLSVIAAESPISLNMFLETMREAFEREPYADSGRLLWVKKSAVLDMDIGTDAFLSSRDSYPTFPSVPRAYVGFEYMPSLGWTQEDNGLAYVGLEAATWEHRDDNRVFLLGYVTLVMEDGRLRSLKKSSAMAAGLDTVTGKLLPYRDVASDEGGFLVDGTRGMRIGNMCPPAPTSRALQHELAYMLRGLWQLWNEPRTVVADTSELVSPTSASSRNKKPKTGKHVSSQEFTFIDVRQIDVDDGCQPSDAPSKVIEHDHRWVVRGHPRMQAYGPGRRLRRRIWIEEHEAGPPGKPLVVKPKVDVMM